MFLRRLLSRVALPTFVAGTGSVAYALWEAKQPVVERREITLRNLPAAFDGLTISFLADTHHGPFVPIAYLAHVVEITNALGADIVVLGGDYVQRRRAFALRRGRDQREYIAPGIGVLAGLRARLGRFAVLGNHDHRTDAAMTRRELTRAGFNDLTNTGVWLGRAGDARLRISGMDDLRAGRPRLRSALGDLREGEAGLLITHNPDAVERIRDPRVDLVLSGHTHGGQVVLPSIGAPAVPSRYGKKYRAGLVQGPTARVYVTRGIGTIWPPVRFRCRPEISFITLRA